MRPDGRQPNQIRPIKMTPNFITYPEGSVLYEQGNTRVLCCASIEDSIPRWMQTQGSTSGWITAEYALLPRSTHTRTQRENDGLSGRTQEIRRLVGRSLRAAVNLQLLGQRTLIIDCDVLQADGGTRCAAVTGGYVALAFALRKLIDAGLTPEDVLLPPIAAISAGMIHGQPQLDLCYQEDSAADVDFNVVMNSDGDYIEIQGTAEGRPFRPSTLTSLLELAQEGIFQLITAQKKALNK
jgi:ribonuclease PH